VILRLECGIFVTAHPPAFSLFSAGWKPCLSSWKPFTLRVQAGWYNESDLHLHLTQVQVSDFCMVRQDFSPPKQRWLSSSEKFTQAGILREITRNARNQIYRADEIFSALDNIQK